MDFRMENKNHKIVNNFITSEEANNILQWVSDINYITKCDNHHIKSIGKELNGVSLMFDISKTEQTNTLATFQSGNNVLSESVPPIIEVLIDRISKTINIPSDNVFLQVLDMDQGGKINPHYDSAIDGFINFKCNISVLSEEYRLIVDKETLNLNQFDLYCFEASLFKHWTEREFNHRRVLLSFGFILPYNKLGRSENDPRVRLSKRIVKYFQQ